MRRTEVITERAPWAPRDPNADRPVTEFGVGAEPTYFGRPGDVVVQFKIKAKYVRFGSATEGGWCALKPAPIRDVKPYQKKK